MQKWGWTMKKILLSILCMTTALLLGSCSLTDFFPNSNQSKTPSGNASFVGSLSQPAEFPPADGDPFSQGSTGKDKEETKAPEGEIRAVWLSYLELKAMFAGDFTANVKSCFETLKQNGMNTVFAQVRPFSDALYPSKLFPWSHIITGTQGQDPGYDPLQIMVDCAHELGLKIEAWINPYRVRAGGSLELSADNPAAKWLSEGSDCVVESGGGLYYNPAREEVISLIVDGVKELVENYELDGIHFDDYFYPTTDENFDKQAFADSGDGRTLEAFRTERVSDLVKRTYDVVKAKNSELLFGISPAGNIGNNLNRLYADVKLWGSAPGYVDYLCPQIYFGFEHETAAFDKMVEAWEALCTSDSVKLYVGLAAYKIGTEDTVYAGSGRDEWKTCEDMLKRQVLCARQAAHYRGFALYRYDSMFSPSLSDQAKKEWKNLKSVLN